MIGVMSAVMAAAGGEIASSNRSLRVMFSFMGFASVIFITIQSIRLARVQKKHEQVQAELLREQEKVAEIVTGGDAVPFIFLFPDFKHPGKVGFVLKNLDERRFLYDISIHVSTHAPLGDLKPSRIGGGCKWDVERVNPMDVKNCEHTFEFDSVLDVFKFEISARNGRFREVFTTRDGKIHFTMERDGKLIYDSDRKEDRVGVWEPVNIFLN
jgi:hypothetical protein